MASCPNCGFDLTPEGRCAVCGYGSADEVKPAGVRRGRARMRPAATPRTSAGRDAAAREPRSTPEGRRMAIIAARRTPIVIAVAAVVLLLAGTVAIVLLGRSPARVPVAAAAPEGGNARSAAPGRGAAASSGSGAAPSSAGSSRATVTPAAGVSQAASKPPVGESGATTSSAKRNAASAPISRVGFAAPVGASPVSIRATHPVDLYDPARQPVYPLSRRTRLPPITSEEAYVTWMLAHTHQQVTYLRERWHRAQLAVERHLVVHKRVLMAFLLTPREWFARPYNLSKVYANTALPIGYGQTISGPDLVMHMTDALDPQPSQRVLEIGTGSGYQSAVLSQLSNYVYTIEIVRPLARQANEIYLEHTKQVPEYANIHRRLADGYYGWTAYAPFDRIIVTTGIDHIPPNLLKQLKPDGIMVIPVGPPTGQTILKITKTVDKQGRVHLTRTNLYPGVTDIFVPFTASGGGTHDLGGGK